MSLSFRLTPSVQKKASKDTHANPTIAAALNDLGSALAAAAAQSGLSDARSGVVVPGSPPPAFVEQILQLSEAAGAQALIRREESLRQLRADRNTQRANARARAADISAETERINELRQRVADIPSPEFRGSDYVETVAHRSAMLAGLGYYGQLTVLAAIEIPLNWFAIKGFSIDRWMKYPLAVALGAVLVGGGHAIGVALSKQVETRNEPKLHGDKQLARLLRITIWVLATLLAVFIVAMGLLRLGQLSFLGDGVKPSWLGRLLPYVGMFGLMILAALIVCMSAWLALVQGLARNTRRTRQALKSSISRLADLVFAYEEAVVNFLGAPLNVAEINREAHGQIQAAWHDYQTVLGEWRANYDRALPHQTKWTFDELIPRLSSRKPVPPDDAPFEDDQPGDDELRPLGFSPTDLRAKIEGALKYPTEKP